MSENNTKDSIKVSGSQKIVLYQGNYKVEKTTLTSRFDFVSRRWKPIDKTVEHLPLDTLDPTPKKQIEATIMFTREAYDMTSLLPIKGYFKQKVKMTVPEMLPNHYITLFNGLFVLNDLSTGGASPLSIKSKIVKVEREKPERISIEEAQKLADEGVKLYKELPDGTLVVELIVPQIRA